MLRMMNKLPCPVLCYLSVSILCSSFVTMADGGVEDTIDTTECGKTKGCMRQPGACLVDTCNFILTWKQHDDNKTVDFEYSVKTTEQVPWIAVGFSNDTQMAKTSVVGCIVNASDSNHIIIQASYNPGHYNTVLKPNNKLGLVEERSEGLYKDGRLSCIFTKLMKVADNVTNSEMVADLHIPHYFFFAQGPADSDGVKNQHSVIPTISPEKIATKDNNDINLGNFIIIHASLMVVAWMLVSTVGIVCSRHYKNVWSFKINDQKIWFQIHRVAMVITFLLSTTAAIIIFVELSPRPLLDQKLHPILGMIVLSLMLINIVLGVIRPSQGSEKRPVFNWAHCLVGNGAHLIAVVTMYFGVLALGNRMVVATWLQWVFVSYGAWRVLIDIILTIEKYYYREDLRVAYVEMSGSGDDIVIESHALHFKKMILGVYLAGVLGLSVATLYGTISPFYVL